MRRSLTDLIGKRVHFIGIGGSGMSGLARIMAAENIEVSGSDIKESSVLTALSAIGVEVHIGHEASNIEGADYVVFSSAIGANNVELGAASAAGIPLLSRAEALSILMSASKSVAVAGTHGKTTTTSMLTVGIQSCGEDPSFAIGGILKASGSNAHRGTGEYFVAEADESDGSFIEYRPYGAIVTNVELDHVDHFADFESVFQAFQSFTKTISKDGFLVYCADDAGSRKLGESVTHCETLSYGTNPIADLRIDEIRLDPGVSRARVLWRARTIGHLEIQTPGHHNLLNAAGALAAGLSLGLPASQFIAGLATYRGTGRRFELKGQVQGIRVLDDYGHHPTEIDVTLDAAKRFADDGRVLVVFQPHRYTRTKAFEKEFAAALDKADHCWVLEVYAASEAPLPGVSGQSIARLMARGHFQPNFMSVVAEVVNEARPGDVVLTLGAGDVSSLGPIIVEALASKYAG